MPLCFAILLLDLFQDCASVNLGNACQLTLPLIEILSSFWFSFPTRRQGLFANFSIPLTHKMFPILLTQSLSKLLASFSFFDTSQFDRRRNLLIGVNSINCSDKTVITG